MTQIIGAALVVIIAVAVVSLAMLVKYDTPIVSASEFKKFNSYDELKTFVESADSVGYYGLFGGMDMVGRGGMVNTIAAPMVAGIAEDAGVPSSEPKAGDYSTTNVQVAGVDEADTIKNDGKYIYKITGDKVLIIDAYPADQAEILAELDVGDGAQEIFVNGDKLVVFGYETIQYEQEQKIEPNGIASPPSIAAPDMMPPYYQRYTNKAFVKVYDITDRENPVEDDYVKINGSYYDSRMIGNYVYFVVNQPVYDPIIMPLIETRTGLKEIRAPDVYYFDVPEYSYRFTIIGALNLNTGEVTEEVYLTGDTQNMFVSMDNIYVTYQKRPDYRYLMERIVNEILIPVLPASISQQVRTVMDSDESDNEKMNGVSRILSDYSEDLSPQDMSELYDEMENKMAPIYDEIMKEFEKTSIHRIAIDGSRITHEAEGSVPGNVLNQFSMDEYNNHFRIATTTGHVSRSGEPSSKNHIYVLNMDMEITGSEEDLAPGERIYSARFIGDRGYIVTFKKVDPLFVIDLSDPNNPQVLGQLKIPGYSDYLHPYDENHIIGLGKEAVAAESGNFAWYQGVKLALFDVSDVSNPREVAKVEIGDRGTDSYALHDHKAFLFSKEKNLLVIPIQLAEIDEDDYSGDVPDNAYGEYKMQGAYVFDVTIENGFQLKGTVTHVDDESILKSGYYYASSSAIQRSLYMDDVLYTISDTTIKMNDLGDLEELNSLDLPYEQPKYPDWYY